MGTIQKKLKRLLQDEDSAIVSFQQIHERKLQDKRPPLRSILPPSLKPWTLKMASWIPKAFLQFSADRPIMKVAFGMQRVTRFKQMRIEGGILRRLLYQPHLLNPMLLHHCRVKAVPRYRIQQLYNNNGVGLGTQFVFLPKTERIHVDTQHPRARLLTHERTVVEAIKSVQERVLVMNGAWKSLDGCAPRSITTGANAKFEYRLVGETLRMEGLRGGWRSCTVGIPHDRSTDDNQIYKTT